MNSNTSAHGIQVQFGRGLRGTGRDGQGRLRMKARTRSVVGPNFVFILVISCYISVHVVGAWNWFGRNSDPAASEEVAPLHIISSNLGASIATGGFPIDGNECCVCICGSRASGFARYVILGSGRHGLVRGQGDGATLVIDGKYPEFILGALKKPRHSCCEGVRLNMVDGRYPATQMVQIFLFNSISGNGTSAIVKGFLPCNGH